MQIKIDINKVGKHIDSYIEEELLSKSLPKCFGRLGIPIVREILAVESDAILKNKHGIADSSISEVNLSKFIISSIDIDLLENMVLDTEGLSYIETYKSHLAKSVAEQLEKCVKCKNIDVCHKITQNYLRTLSILRS